MHDKGTEPLAASAPRVNPASTTYHQFSNASAGLSARTYYRRGLYSLFTDAFDGAKYACLGAAMTASLASITDSILEACPVTTRSGQKVYGFYYDTQDDAILSGVYATRETISSLCQQDTGPIPHSEMDHVPRHISWTAVNTIVQHIFYKNVTRSQTVIRIVGAPRIGLCTGLDSGDPINYSMAALSAALTAIRTANRSAIKLQSQPLGDS